MIVMDNVCSEKNSELLIRKIENSRKFEEVIEYYITFRKILESSIKFKNIQQHPRILPRVLEHLYSSRCFKKSRETSRKFTIGYIRRLTIVAEQQCQDGKVEHL